VKLGGIPCRGSCGVPGPFALRLQWPPMKSSGPSIPQPRARLSGTSAWGLSRPGVRVVWPFPPALFEIVPQHESHEVPSLFDLPRAKRSGRGDPDLGSFYGDTFGSHSPFEVLVGDGVGATLHVYLTRSTRTSSGRLSWGCPRISPPSTQSTRVHSQVGSREGARPSARTSHGPNSFRPCRSSRLRRFSPRVNLQACCILQPTMGFATFREACWNERLVRLWGHRDVSIASSLEDSPFGLDCLPLARQPGPACTDRSGSWDSRRVAPFVTLVLSACFIWDPRWTSPSIGVRVTRCRASRTRRLVRTRNTLPCLLPWDAHPRAPSSMKPELSSSFLLPLWRHTLRRLLLDSSRAASPRPLPSRPTGASVSLPCCHD
jgi:hypothetical protein